MPSACWNDLRRLCATDAPRQRNGFWRSLDTLGHFFGAYIFGGLKDNFPLESIFATYGNHIEEEQSDALKEALVMHTLALAPERDMRRDASMRVTKKSDVARARYEQQRAEREAAGKSEDLARSDDNRAQLVMHAQQLVHRIAAAADVVACDELGRTAAQYGANRAAAWQLLVKRQLCAQEA